MKDKLNAIGCFIFGGSQTIGHMQAGWNVDRVLEMTENMKEINSAHFVKNYPDIPIVLPSEWSAEGYLESLNGRYDLFFANNPCSGLSRINLKASAENKTNDHFYEVFNIIKKIDPKIFFLENAPTLVSYGTPILKKMAEMIGSEYRFTIIRDKASNHGVCMPRTRTFVIGWNRKHFNEIPVLRMNREKQVSLRDVIGKPLDGVANCELDPGKKTYLDCVQLYKYMPAGDSVFRTSVRYYDKIKDEFSERWRRIVDHDMEKMRRKNLELKEGKGVGGIWDKSPYRPFYDKLAPSMTSISFFVHPEENRDFYIREYARIMGYPDDFVFYPEASKVSCVQACAQGVPVNFIKYISKELKRVFEEGVSAGGAIDNSKDLTFQNHIAKTLISFTLEEFKAINKNLLDISNENAIHLTE